HIIHSTFGKIYRIGSFERSRGCPYGCAYCINKYLQNYYSGKGKYHRKKSVDRLINEILYFKEKYKIEFVYLADETFLLDNNWLKEFSEKYKNKVDLPFSFMTRAETATEEKMELAAAAGAKYVSIGIESGSEEFRRKYLNRKMTNEQIINAFRSAKKYGIETNSFNMIGFPYETEEDIFKTIKLNKIIQPDNIQCTIFYPFKGTELYKLCLENNFINENNLSAKNYYSSSILNFPNKKKTKIIRTRNLFEYLCSNKSLITKLLELSLNYKIIYNIFYGCIKIKKQNQYFYNLYKNIGFYKFIRHIIKKLCAY
ncbi:MAG TPA: radical SAM protein, partial [bacterium]|nr:radical SAM protein [bacterium]